MEAVSTHVMEAENKTKQRKKSHCSGFFLSLPISPNLIKGFLVNELMKQSLS